MRCVTAHAGFDDLPKGDRGSTEAPAVSVPDMDSPDDDEEALEFVPGHDAVSRSSLQTGSAVDEPICLLATQPCPCCPGLYLGGKSRRVLVIPPIGYLILIRDLLYEQSNAAINIAIACDDDIQDLFPVRTRITHYDSELISTDTILTYN